MKRKLYFAIIIVVAIGCFKLMAQPVLYGVASQGGSSGTGTLFKFDATTQALDVKKNFNYSEGGYPYGTLLHASNGMLYGTTYQGGSSGYGTLFEYDPTSETFNIKANFDYTNTGAYLRGDLTEMDNGDIIGISTSGGTYGYGTIWKYEIASNTLTKLKDFDYNSGGYPQGGGITQASNGRLYGLTWQGGQGGSGTFYELDPTTNSFTVLQSFNYSNGANGIGKMVEVDGKLFGITYQGGTSGAGTIFEYDIDALTFTTRFSFNNGNYGGYPYSGGMHPASNGLLYGTNTSGGQYGNGTLFSFDPQSGNVNKLHDFNYYGDGYAYNPVTEASDGNLYGMTYYGYSNSYQNSGSIYKYDLAANTFSTLKIFDYSATGGYPFWTGLIDLEGSNPFCRSLTLLKTSTNISCAGLSDGAIDITVTGATSTDYSFLWSNGATTEDISNLPVGNYSVKVTVNDINGCSKRAFVKVIQPTPLTTFAAAKKVSFNGTSDGSVNLTVSGGTTPYEYAWANGGTTEDLADVAVGIYSVIVTDANGCQQGASAEVTKRATAQSDLYGVAQSGGSNGGGTLFKSDYASNTLEVKHDFSYYNSEGYSPTGKLLYASNDMLYGTSVNGGTYGVGTLFEYDPSSEVLTKKIDFDYSTTGANPYGHPIQLDNGDIIGTSTSGGANGYGTIWKYDIASNTITILKDFDGSNTGAYPYNGVTQASNGKLYGLTWYYGLGGYGTLYEFDLQTNSFVILQSLSWSNGAYGIGKLTEVNGKLFGVTHQGGGSDAGTIFEYDITASSFTIRYSFDNGTAGAYPYVGLNQASNGLLYGTNQNGGQYGFGTLFSFDPQSGSVNKVHDFNYYGDGYSYNPVMQASDGNLYGMTYQGNNHSGSIYQFDPSSSAYSTLQYFDSNTNGAYPFWTELTEIGQVNTDPCLADNIAPIVVTKNITVQLDANGTASIVGSDINDGSTDNCTIASYALDKRVFDCSNVGDNTVNLTVTDVSGNSASATATVTVEDKIAPAVVTKNITVQLDAHGNASIEVGAVNNGSSDNCAIASYALDKASFDCTNVGDNTVTLSVTDVNGNTASALAAVTVKDEIAPSVVTQNVALYLNSSGTTSTTAAAVNNGSSDNCAIASYALDKASFDCTNVGDNTVTLTVTDVNGNTASAPATVTVKDIITPVIIGLPSNITLRACDVTATWTEPTFSDNCAGVSIVQSAGPPSGDPSAFANGSTQTITYTATDASGNYSSSSFTVTRPEALATTVTTTNPYLYFGYSGDQSAIITAIPSGGIGPYTVSITMNRSLLCNMISSSGDEIWDASGATNYNTTCPAAGAGLAPFSTQSVSAGGAFMLNVNLMADAIIMATITDANGCVTTGDVHIDAEDVRCFNGSGKQKVQICHRTGSAKNPCVQICVDESAVAEHIAHGDYYGKCNTTCTAPVANARISSDNSSSERTIDENTFAESYPNPFKSSVSVSVSNPEGRPVNINMIDLIGRNVNFRQETPTPEGIYLLDTEQVSSGLYFLRVKIGDYSKTIKLLKE